MWPKEFAVLVVNALADEGLLVLGLDLQSDGGGRLHWEPQQRSLGVRSSLAPRTRSKRQETKLYTLLGDHRPILSLPSIDGFLAPGNAS